VKITIKEFNIQTNQEAITERDETTQEQTVRETLELEAATRQAEAEAKATAKAALLSKLGITPEEAVLLLS
jgi:hypothetical protein